MSLLNIKNFYLNLRIKGEEYPVLLDVNLSVKPGEIHSVVGESGCGKSITSLAITRLIPPDLAIYKSGEILFKGRNILELDELNLRALRGKEISYIFQDPFTSLNPIKKIKEQIIESYILHISENRKEAIEKAQFLLNEVGITELEERLESYPAQMSGGMLQRISIAMALMCDPSLLIADEPTSALDVTIQSQLVDLLLKLKNERKMSILFISHDIGLVGSISESISVMYAGQVIETGSSENIILSPLHPYTKSLISSIPSLHGLGDRRLATIPGIVPSLGQYPEGCHFSTRCNKVFDKCNKKPSVLKIDESKVRCHLYEENDQIDSEVKK
jgi:peptide/nickel transport system ATP-binding protein